MRIYMNLYPATMLNSTDIMFRELTWCRFLS